MRVRRVKAAAVILSIVMVGTYSLYPSSFSKAEGESGTQVAKSGERVACEDTAIKSESTPSSTTFDLQNGKKQTIFYGESVRYTAEDGTLKEYDPSLVKSQRAGFAYENKTGDSKQYLPSKLTENTPVLLEKDNYRAELKLAQMQGKEVSLKEAQIEDASVRTAYNETKRLPVKAVYDARGGDVSVEYISSEHGLKENFVLNTVPETPTLQYQLRLTGLYPRKNALDEGITLYDRETDKIVGDIPAPFMNDAGGESVSYAITQTIEKEEGSSDTYNITLAMDEDYLSNRARQYPVKVDPSLTWRTYSNLLSVYVASGYKNTNFYDSGIKIFNAGKNSTGIYRTYMKFSELADKLKGKSVTKAQLTMYETGNGTANETIRAHRVKALWKCSTLTWNNRPDYQETAYDSIKTKRTSKTKQTLDLTSHVRKVAAEEIGSYGIMLRNKEESSSGYTEFYNARFATAKYRPKLTVTFYDKPTQASAVSVAPQYVKKGNTVKVSWSGIKSSILKTVQYRIAACSADGTVTNENVVPYTSLAVNNTSGTATLTAAKTLAEGRYRVYIRGQDTAGSVGIGRSAHFWIDGKAPEITASLENTSTKDAPSAVKTPRILCSATDENGASVEYRVDGGAYKSATLSDGGFHLASSDLAKTGDHSIEVRAVDKAGNVSQPKSFTYYIDNDPPTIDSAMVKTTDHASLADAWTKDTDPEIILRGIDDEGSGPAMDTLRYAICPANAEEPAEEDYRAPQDLQSEEKEDGYAVSFHLREQDRPDVTGIYSIHIKVDDRCGTRAVKTVAYRLDCDGPSGSITAKKNGQRVQNLQGTVQITGRISDDESGVKTSTMRLIKAEGEDRTYICDIYSGYTTNKETSVDTTTWENGEYILRLEAEDHAGNTSVQEETVMIQNPLGAPRLSAEPNGEGRCRIQWSYDDTVDSLQALQYRLPGDDSWHAVSAGNKKEGSFQVELPAQEGAYSVKVRAVDVANVLGKEAAVSCIVDQTAPTTALTSFERGVLKGTAKDEHMARWTVSIRQKNASAQSALAVLSGSDSIEDGRLGVIDLTSDLYQTGITYVIRLEAEDLCGNQSEIEMEVTKSENTICERTIAADVRITRPKGQSYDSSNIRLGTRTQALHLHMAADVSAIPNTYDVQWYENAHFVMQGASYRGDPDTGFSQKQQDTAYALCAVYQDALGVRHYSAARTENAAVMPLAFSNAADTQEKTATVVLPKDAISFRLLAKEQTEDGRNITYTVMKEDGSYISVTPGASIDAAALDEGALTVPSLTVRATITDGGTAQIPQAKVLIDTLAEETYTISAIEDYRADELYAKDKINYKTYLKWKGESELTSQELQEQGITYEVYRSTEKDFVPSLENRIAKDITSFYFSEMNTGYDQTYYYRVCAVKKTAQEVQRSSFSPQAGSQVVSESEYTKRLGTKEYWDYAQQDTPNGMISIEKSKGNLTYEQIDAEIENEKLPFTLTRTYNSQSTAVSALGKGWTHSYDMELLSLQSTDDASSSEYVFKDADGTIYTFSEDADGEGFTSSMGKDYTLQRAAKTQRLVPIGGEEIEVKSAFTMMDKGGTEYRFNSGGQLVYLGEPNGNWLYFSYDAVKGVLEKAVSSRNLMLRFVYENEDHPLLVSSVELPDASSVEYAYDQEGHLIQAARVGGDERIEYSLSYAEGKLTTIHDAKGNSYSVTYEGEKAIAITNPDQSGLRLTYNGLETKEGAMRGSLAVAEEKTWYDALSGCKTRYIENNGKETYFVYEDGQLVESRRQTDHVQLTGNTAVSSEDLLKEKNTYNENANPSVEKEEDGTSVETSYGTTTLTENQPTHVREKIGDLLLADEVYSYDAKGNEVKKTDAVTDTEEETRYIDGEDDEDAAFAGEISSSSVKEDGHLTEENTYTYWFDEGGHKVVRQVNRRGAFEERTTTTYDTMGREKRIDIRYTGGSEDASQLIENTYDGLGRLIRIEETKTNAAGVKTNVTTMVYDANGNVVKSSSNGKTISYTYDQMNRQRQEVVNKNGDSKTYTTTYTFGTAAQVHALHGTTDVSNTEIVTQMLDNEITSRTYTDQEGCVVREESNGLCTDKSYDAEGNVIGAYIYGQGSEDDGLMTAYTYDVQGNETAEIKDPAIANGTVTASAHSIVTTTRYDADGNKIAATDGVGQTTRYTYDERARLTSVTLPSGHEQGISYQTTENGSRTTVTDGSGHVNITCQDVAGHTVKTIDQGDTQEEKIETTYAFDAQGHPSRVQYPKGNYVDTFYTADGSVSEIRGYDHNGQLQSIGRHTYDVDGQETAERVYAVCDGEEQLVLARTYTYTGLGNVDTVTETIGGRTSTLQYTYDALDRPISVDYSGTGSLVKGMLYEYNAYGWLTSIKVRIGGSIKTLRKYTYTKRGEVSSIVTHRDLLDGITEKTSLISFAYDRFDRPLSMQYKEAGDDAVKASAEVVYDKAGRIVQEDFYDDYLKNEEPGRIDQQRRYRYDADGQLHSVETSNHIDETKITKTYSYDAAGNRVRCLESGDGSSDTRYTYNGLDQLLSLSTTQNGETVAKKTFSYDENGNRIEETDAEADVTMQYAYDPYNRLQTVTEEKNVVIEPDEDAEDGDSELLEPQEQLQKTVVQKNTYDETGQRISKVEGDAVTNYFRQGSANLFTTNAQDDLVSFNLLSDAGKVIATERPSETGAAFYYYIKDIHGSTTDLIDAAGNAHVSYTYDVFGETTKYGDLENEIAYTGGIYDEVTGQYYLNARYYDPSTARFMSQDTYRGDIEEPDSTNLYAYCGNDPVNFEDPSGHKKKKKFKSLYSTLSKKQKKKLTKKEKLLAKKIPCKRSHFGRNKKNINLPKTEYLAIKNGWRKHLGNAAHQNNNDPKWSANTKYVKGSKEVIYFGNGKINNTPEDRGSYNFGKGSSTESHSLNDMAPWVAWGNSSKKYGNKGSDSTTCKGRKSSAAYFNIPKTGKPFPKANAAIKLFNKLNQYGTVK